MHRKTGPYASHQEVASSTLARSIFLLFYTHALPLSPIMRCIYISCHLAPRLLLRLCVAMQNHGFMQETGKKQQVGALICTSKTRQWASEHVLGIRSTDSTLIQANFGSLLPMLFDIYPCQILVRGPSSPSQSSRCLAQSETITPASTARFGKRP